MGQAPDGVSLQQLFKSVAKLHYRTVHDRLSVKEVFPGQPPLLAALSKRDGQSQKELAEGMRIAPATVNVMIGRMEKTGLLERRADSTDSRVSRVYLTEKGRAAYADIREELRRIEALFFDGFEEEERERLRGLLLRMHDNLQKAGSAP